MIGGITALAVVAATTLLVVTLDRPGDDGDETAAEPASGDPTNNLEPTDEVVAPAELETIEDSTGALGVSVPSAWDDQDLRPFGPGEPNILVATDIEDYFRSYDAAGINFTGFAADSPVADRYFQPSSELQMEDFLWFSGRFAGDRDDIPRNACDGVDSDDFAAGGFTGRMETYTDCDENGSDVVYVAGTNDDDSVGIAIELILVDGDEKAAVDAILNSLVANVLG